MSDSRAIGAPDMAGVESDQSSSQQEAGKLELENKMLRAVLDSMADNISIKDLKGRYVFDNAAHCRFLGASRTADVVGKTVFDFLPPEIASKFYAEDLLVLESGEPLVRSVDPSVDSAGNRVWMSVTKMPLRDEDGRLIGLISATHDITATQGGRGAVGALRREVARKKCPTRRGFGNSTRVTECAPPPAISQFSELCLE